MPRQKHQRHKSAKESAEPGEPKPADQYRRICNQLAGTLQNVIQARSYQTGESGNADNKKPFVVVAWLAATLQVTALHELCAGAVKIGLQEICSGQQARGDHEAESRNCERPNMEKRNPRRRGASPSKVYTRARSCSNAALI